MAKLPSRRSISSAVKMIRQILEMDYCGIILNGLLFLGLIVISKQDRPGKIQKLDKTKRIFWVVPQQKFSKLQVTIIDPV